MIPITMSRNPEELWARLDKSQPVFVDSETQGLYGKIRIMQFYQPHWDRVFIWEYPEAFALVSTLANIKHVWHNAHYDLTCIQTAAKLPLAFTDYEDTFLLARLAMPQYESYSLDDVMTFILGFDPYLAAGLKKSELQKSDWKVPVLSEVQLQYAATDVWYLPQVYEAVKSAIDTPSYTLDKSTLNSALHFQWNGMPVDSERLDKKWIEVEAELAKIDMPINANSWQQVRDWLNIDASDKQYLSKLALRDGNDKARAVLDVRTLRKLQSFMTKYDVDRVVGKFKPSARSGRLTSDKENLQQIPRKLKEIFGYPEDSDRTFIYSDYAQLELRTICAWLAVKVMAELFRRGEDLHGFVATVLFGADFTPADRQVTKTYNFNLLYGGSVGMVLSILITYGFWLEEVEANRHKRKWMNMFKEISAWQEECTSKWRKGKLTTTPLGRSSKAKLMTDFMNIINQGAGAEVAKLALHYFYPKLAEYNEENNTDVMLVNFIHDSYILDCPNDPAVYEPVSKMLAECMQDAWFEMSKLYKIKDLPMPVNVKVGNNWGDLEKDIGVKYQFNLEGMEMYNAGN